jgi:hypothetical protein
VSPAVSQLAQRIPRNRPIRCSCPGCNARQHGDKPVKYSSPHPLNLFRLRDRRSGTGSIPRSAHAAGLNKTGCNELSKWESSSDSVGCVLQTTPACRW